MSFAKIGHLPAAASINGLAFKALQGKARFDLGGGLPLWPNVTHGRDAFQGGHSDLSAN